jgi:hypothetical protein
MTISARKYASDVSAAILPGEGTVVGEAASGPDSVPAMADTAVGLQSERGIYSS